MARKKKSSGGNYGVYIRSFDGYENVWKLIRGGLSKTDADALALKELLKRSGVAEIRARPM